MANYMIGIDIGTTSTKSVLFTEQGEVITTSTQEYPLYTPAPNVAEQDPEEIVQAAVFSIRNVMNQSGVSPNQILFVSCSSAMHSVIAMDQHNHPLTRCITWADNRSAAWSAHLEENGVGHRIYRHTGTPIHPMSPLTKLMWLRHDEPDLFQRTAKFISIKEYLFFRLFGQYIIDYSIASCTGLFNLEQLDWDQEALDIAGITPRHLSKLVPTTYTIEGIHPEWAEKMALSPSTPFVIGASDGVLSNLGVNAIKPGIVAATIGTSGAIRTVVDRPITDPKGRTFCYALTENLWVIGGPVNNGGMLFRWVRDEFAASEVETAKRLGINSYDVLTKIAERVPAGSEGLLFHPYLSGERAPLWNPDARGSFFGLTLHHKKEHMIRAVLEGVIFNLYTVLLAMEEQIGQPSSIQATGGFARSPLWRQMMSDIFNQEVVVPESFESSCLGAVVLGLYATGRIKSLHAVSSMVGTTHRHTPVKKHASIYQELLPIYIRISRKLEDEYADIAEFQRKMSMLHI
ncbi:MAG: gluconokinase [Paenibacillus sp.]|uniref:gluconokinase n=1 Tax=Paenibacillus sp. TaxID=58172 RepID=UPI0025FC8D60|nr:gluconokinase [Paenibacillus sp.]MBR2565095.1 gluconokinase [Paenibacillus sp.]